MQDDEGEAGKAVDPEGSCHEVFSRLHCIYYRRIGYLLFKNHKKGYRAAAAQAKI